MREDRLPPKSLNGTGSPPKVTFDFQSIDSIKRISVRFRGNVEKIGEDLKKRGKEGACIGKNPIGWYVV